MKKMWVFVLAAALIVGFSLPAIAGSCGYVVNGDFSDTVNLGFTTGYSYRSEAIWGSDYLWGAKYITIVDNPEIAHEYWKYGPVNVEGNKMLVVNGSTEPGTIIWEQEFNLKPDTNYVFSFELANVSWIYPAQIYVLITPKNGDSEPINDVPFTIQGVEYEEGKWKKFEMMINSGETGEFEITFKNTTTAHSGNDFAMDNICLTDLPLSVDIKPGSCPNAFNLKQRGVVPVAIMGSDIFDVTQIDLESIELCLDGFGCIEPIRVEILDVGKPCIECEGCYCVFSYYDNGDTIDSDDILDLNLKFASTDLATMLMVAGYGKDDFVPVSLTIKADYSSIEGYPDQKTLQGQDCIVIVNE